MNTKTIVRIIGTVIVFSCLMFGLSSSAKASTDSGACVKVTVNDYDNRFDRGTIGVRASEAVIANNCSEDMTISSLGFLGSFGSGTLSGARLYVNGKSSGYFNKVTSTSAVYTGLSLKVARGSSIKIMLIGDVSKDPSDSTLSYTLDDCPKVFVIKGDCTGKMIAANVIGSSSIYISQKMKIYSDCSSSSAAKTQSVKVTTVGGIQKVQKGTRVNVIEARLTNTGSEELTVSGMGFSGLFGTKGVTNTNLWVDEVNMGSLKGSASAARYTGMNIKIAPGKSVRVVLRGDISSSATKRVLQYRFDSDSKVFQVKGSSTGKSAKISVSGLSVLGIAK